MSLYPNPPAPTVTQVEVAPRPSALPHTGSGDSPLPEVGAVVVMLGAVLWLAAKRPWRSR